MIHVAELMTEKVFTLQRIDTLRDVRSLMELSKIRHIPVVDEKGLFIGLVTHRDLLSYTVSKLAAIEADVQAEIESAIMVGDIMRTGIATVTPNTLLQEAADTLYRNKYGCLPVVVEGKLVGIITESDFLRLAIALLGRP